MKNIKLKESILFYVEEDKYILINGYLDEGQNIIPISSEEYFALMATTEKKELNESEQKIIQSWLAKYPAMFYQDYLAEKKQFNTLKAMKRLKRLATAYKDVKEDHEVVEYHQTGITDAMEQFDHNETTVSHMFRDKNRALKNRSYGEALCDKIISEIKVGSNLNSIEIGCGTGILANNVLNRLKEKYPEIYAKLNYTMFDLSPALQSAQKIECNGHLDKINFISGNIETYDFKDNKFDLVLSNEVIADLNVSVAEKEKLKTEKGLNEAEKLIKTYDLDIKNFPPKFILSTEAIKLIPKLKKILKSDGVAILTEYGSLDEPASTVKLHGHNEYTINFTHLKTVAEFEQMKATVETLGDYLDFDTEVKVLDHRVRVVLQAYLIPFLEMEQLPRRNYDEDLIKKHFGKKYENIKHLTYRKLGDKNSILNPFRFYAMTMRF